MRALEATCTRNACPRKRFTEPVALSSTASVDFPSGLAASTYGPQRRFQLTRAPCSVLDQRIRWTRALSRGPARRLSQRAAFFSFDPRTDERPACGGRAVRGEAPMRREIPGLRKTLCVTGVPH